MQDIRSTSKLIFRNVSFNVLGRIIPLIIGVACLPFIISGLGIEQFGILSIVWASLLNYFTFFDLGLGQGLTKFVSQFFYQEERLSRLIWTSFAFALVLGLLGTVVVILITPVLVNDIFKISPEYIKKYDPTFDN